MHLRTSIFYQVSHLGRFQQGYHPNQNQVENMIEKSPIAALSLNIPENLTNLQRHDLLLRRFFGYLSQHTNVLNGKGNQRKKSFGHLVYFVFSEGGCYVVQSQNLYYQKNTLRSYVSPVKTLLLLYCTHYTLCCALEPLLIFGMLSNMMS